MYRRRRPPLIVALILAALAMPSTAQDAPKASTRAEDLAPASEFLDVGGVKTHVVRRGDKGRPVVLVHGFGSSTYTWRKSLEVLSGKYRVFAVDMRGFGLTAKPKDGKYNIVEFADHLLATLDALELGDAPPVLVGSSLGGAVILRLALLHPDRVAGLVLVDAAPVGVELATPRPRQPRPMKLDPLLLRAMVGRGMVERGLRSSFYDQALVTPEMVDAYLKPTEIDGAMEALSAMMDAPAEVPTPPLSTLKKPVLIAWGRHDRVIPVALAGGFAREIAGSKTVVFENSGHLPHEEEPAAFHRALTEFVDQIP